MSADQTPAPPATPAPALPCFSYHGGKTRLAPVIASLIGPHRTYVEPFAGSLAVFLAKAPSPTEIINDLDTGIVTFYRVLRTRPDELVRACSLTPYARGEYEACRLDDPELDELERARRWWVRTNYSIGKHSWSIRGSGFAAAPDTGGASNARKTVTHVGRMHAIAARLRTAIIEHRPALEVLAKYATAPDVAVYADPPYLGSTRSLDRRRRTRDYSHDMPAAADHAALLEVLLASPAAVILSGYHSDLYDSALTDWWMLEVTVDKPSANGRRAQMAKATEVIWSNRPPPGQLRLDLSDEEASP